MEETGTKSRDKKRDRSIVKETLGIIFIFFISAVFSLVEKIPFFRFDGKNSCRFPNQGQNVVNLIKPF